MREAADREDATEKSAVTPGPIKPARELLGEMLMELERPAEALAAFETTLTKNRIGSARSTAPRVPLPLPDKGRKRPPTTRAS